jgi:O-antigen/teichoic acid export membrane protein
MMPEKGVEGTGSEQRLMSPKAAVSIMNGVFGAVLSTMALVFIAKRMGPDVMGVLGFSISGIGLLSFLSDFGAGSVHATQINRGEDLGKCVGAYALIKLVSLIIFAGVTLLLIELWANGYIDGAMEHTPTVTNSLLVFLVYFVLLGISQIATHTFEALGSVSRVHLPALLEQVVRVSFIVYVATNLRSDPQGPALLASSYAVGMMAATILVALFLTKVKISFPDRQILGKYLRSLAPVFFVSMILIFDLYLDKAVVGYFWGEREVGLYFGVQKMAIFVGVFSLAMATMILPSVTTYFTRRDMAAGWDVVNQAERYVSLVAIPTAAFYLIWGTDILKVFLTDEFASAVNTMNLLVISSTLVALVLPLRSAIAGVGKPGTLFLVGVGGVLLQLVLLLVFVPSDFFGLPAFALKGNGAALALLVTSIYYFFVLRYMVWSTAKVTPNSRSFKHLLGAVVMIGVMYSVKWFFIPTVDWIALMFLAVVGLLSYALTAFVIGELEPADYKYFRALLGPRDAIQYVANELLGRRSH